MHPTFQRYGLLRVRSALPALRSLSFDPAAPTPLRDLLTGQDDRPAEKRVFDPRRPSGGFYLTFSPDHSDYEPGCGCRERFDRRTMPISWAIRATARYEKGRAMPGRLLCVFRGSRFHFGNLGGAAAARTCKPLTSRTPVNIGVRGPCYEMDDHALRSSRLKSSPLRLFLHHFPSCETEKLHHFPKYDIREALSRCRREGRSVAPTPIQFGHENSIPLVSCPLCSF